MKRSIAAAALVSTVLAGHPVFAGQLDDIEARLAALEKENAAIRKENTLLRENKTLRATNESLKTSVAPTAPRAPVSASVAAAPTKPSVFDAMAADLPVAYKARPLDTPGQFQVWVEGGAIWSGGDPVTQTGTLVNFGGIGLPGFGGNTPYNFDLMPKLGWEAATGFDYRVANSPWHVSGQFRYGQSGKASGSASSGGAVDPTLLALLGLFPAGTSVSGSDQLSDSYKEKRWLADLAVGRDIAGSGRNALQLKGGMRIAEFADQFDSSETNNATFNFGAPFVLGGGLPAVSSISNTTNTATSTRARFLGAGPMVGLQGSVPFAGNWSFDYLGDAAILFGTQQSTSTTLTTVAISPAFLGALGGGIGFGGGFPGIATATSQQFAYVFSGDIQAGVSYWVTPNLKVGASYRLDALINVGNETSIAANGITPSRYTHGPRVTVTGQF